jgi:two-component system NtrC family sensor kinase
MANSMDEFQHHETQVLVQNLNYHLISLATSLKGRLSPGEEETLANLFQVQMNLQALLAEMPSNTNKEKPSSVATSAREQEASVSQYEADSIAHAQAMQYARDLVKAIRQKKEHQRRLELTSQQLIRAEKLATVGQIAATVAHELGNILTPLLMYAKLIHKESAEPEDSEITEFANQIMRIANRASDMLRQLVDAARSERAMMIPVNVVHVIDNMLGLLAPRINRQGINIKQHYPGQVPLVMGRPDQLEQVFINIGINAFDAMPSGGNFVITVQPGNGTDDPSAEANFITIRLSDTGVGIPPENIGLLFEPFFSTKERGAGSGLGLFVSHLIVNQHGGAIEVESEQGVGTTSIVKLPTVDEETDT